jgi:hypothetical protein
MPLLHPAGAQVAAGDQKQKDYGWPERYICTVYDRMYGDFPAKNTVYTPYIYGSGQP